MKKIVSHTVCKTLDFLNVGIWRMRANKLPGQKFFWIRQLRIVLLAIRGFNENLCQLRASALTFYSLLSVVPLMAMAFGVAKGFGLEKLLERQLRENSVGQEEAVEKIINFSGSLLQNTQGGLIAGVGVALLFWTIIQLLGNIENSFNDIWGVKQGRTFGRKFCDYLSIMLICPIFLIMSGSVTILITSQVTLLVEKLSFLGPLGKLILLSLKILPFAVLWGVFTFIYIFMPNTKVQFKSGLFAGIIAGTIYQVVQWAYFTFQIGVNKYGAIYGSFAALPLFLIWLQLSWLVVLFGAEVSFAEQNVETYEFEPDCLNVSHSLKRLLALTITKMCVQKFHECKEPLTIDEIAHQLELPIRLARQIFFELTESRALSEVKLKNGSTGFQPACDIERFSIVSVSEILDNYGICYLPIAESDDLEKIKKTLLQLLAENRQSAANVLLRNL